MRFLGFFLIFILLISAIFALNKKDLLAPGAPPMGKFLSPFHGFWQNCDPEDPQGDDLISNQKLKQDVNIVFDDRMTPHIFAKNDYDLYFAQGFLTAKFRLWQMETQTHFAAGRLSEIMGEKLIKTDRFYRRIGMVKAAQEALNKMMEDSISRTTLEAYTAGVNSYIDNLSSTKYPFEYKLLDYEPEHWTPLKTALLLKYMAWDLTGSNKDVEMTNILAQYGPEIVQDLFPNHSPYSTPIIPHGTKWEFEPLKLPKAPPYISVGDTQEWASNNYLKSKSGDYAVLGCNNLFEDENYHDINGSNNWTLSGTKTITGYPLLANDPHLGLTLPSLWFEMQLISPTVNVYGVTLPGAPGVIIGFNDFVSWGVTNSGADVFDWYKIKYEDNNKKYYFYGDSYKEIEKRIDTIKVRDSETIYDTVLSTHHGPIVYHKPSKFNKENIPLDCAMRWAAHEPSNELKTFYLLNRSKTYTHYLQALSHYDCPAQNFVFADKKNIAMRSNGRYPLRWVNQGKYIMDGSDPRTDWQGWLPREHIPCVKNPARAYVSSGNQEPADSTYPYYLDYAFETYERGKRINMVLDSMKDATVDSMRALQNDNFNLLAAKTLPKMLKYTQATGKNKFYGRSYHAISTWNYKNDVNSIGASIYKLWWFFLERNIWEDNFPSSKMIYPNRARTAKLITQDTVRKWYDDIRTKNKKETFIDLVNLSFEQAVDSLSNRFPRFEHWLWANVKATTIPHLSRSSGLKSFGHMNLRIGGGTGIVNATTSSHGPSWRMVVSMGPYIRGYGVYPGGQSGNPASIHYDDKVDYWVKGQLQELFYIRKFANQGKNIKATLKMTKD